MDNIDSHPGSEPTDADPKPGIRVVFLAGFFAGSIFGLLVLAVRGHLRDAMTQNPLSPFGTFLGVGLVGSILGGVGGLSLRMLLGSRPGAWKWRVSIAVATLISAAAGLGTARFLVALLWGD